MPFRTAKSAAIPSPAKKKTILTSLCSGSSRTPKEVDLEDHKWLDKAIELLKKKIALQREAKAPFRSDSLSLSFLLNICGICFSPLVNFLIWVSPFEICVNSFFMFYPRKKINDFILKKSKKRLGRFQAPDNPRWINTKWLTSEDYTSRSQNLE